MKAVLFDVYETLLTGTRREDRELWLRKVANNFELAYPKDQSLAGRLDEEVCLEHRQSSSDHPEVDIRELWARIFPTLQDPDSFALAVEEAIHPVEPIPEAEETILKLYQRGIRLGIVSNAQAYTRILMQRHFPLGWPCFEAELLLFSYEHRTAKPGRTLFQLAMGQLALDGILPDQIMMVGDSITNDIEPARSLGFQAHLIRTGTFDLPL